MIFPSADHRSSGRSARREMAENGQPVAHRWVAIMKDAGGIRGILNTKQKADVR